MMQFLYDPRGKQFSYNSNLLSTTHGLSKYNRTQIIHANCKYPSCSLLLLIVIIHTVADEGMPTKPQQLKSLYWFEIVASQSEHSSEVSLSVNAT